ncbi:MAG: hypothetical protein JWP56_656 [Aeromicrobium sp.]|nr:hypothetical protein [Aeromicrobium sp.]
MTDPDETPGGLGDGGSVHPLVHALGPFWSLRRTCEALDLGSEEDVIVAVSVGSVIGLRTSDGVAVFPVRQFERAGSELQVRAYVRVLLSELLGQDPWSVALVVLSAELPELAGRTFAQAVDDGIGLQVVRELAALIRREWTSGEES